MFKKIIITLCICLVFSAAASAEVKFNDVPEDHWAAKAVYDLVKLGVTQGYPDGTFRGSRNITRYETAVFLSKLASAAGGGAATEKLIEELRAEVAELRNKTAGMKADGLGVKISGSLQADYLVGNLLVNNSQPRGPVVRYRLKTQLSRDLGHGANIKVNLDTMDAGFYGGSENIATKLLDLEGNFKVDLGLENPIAVKLTSGPGPVKHTVSSNILPSEYNVTYIRPRNTVTLSTTMLGFDLSTGYQMRVLSSAGEVGVHQLTGTAGYTFSNLPVLGKVKITGSSDYFVTTPLATPAGPHDLRAKITLSAEPDKKVKLKGTLGAGKTENYPHGLYLGGELTLADYFNTGTNLRLIGHKVGTEYLFMPSGSNPLDEGAVVGYDLFDKTIPNGVVVLDAEISQIITDKLTLKGRGDLRLNSDLNYGKNYSNSNLTVEGGLSYAFEQSTSLETAYRIYDNPSGTVQHSDMLLVGVIHKW